ncbi:MAG: hypothetical protein ABJB85_12235 [Nitrososphaerota archaeon]
MRADREFEVIVILFVVSIALIFHCKYFSPAFARAKASVVGPIINNSSLKTQLITTGPIEFIPTELYRYTNEWGLRFTVI